MYKVCACIITYNPDTARLADNIEMIVRQTSLVIIVDNGSANYEKIVELKEATLGSVLLARNERNMGIAAALNRGFSIARNMGFDWCISLDQDSVATPNLVSSLSKSIRESVAIVCPSLQDRNYKAKSSNSGIHEVQQCITSGSLTRVYAWESVKGFDERMFIDGVDFDFCYRLVENGWKIFQNDTVILIHEIGKITIKKFLWKTVIIKNHSAMRKYYISRNIIYIAKKRRKPLLLAFAKVIKQSLIVLVYENNKIKKTNAILRGLFDGIKMRP